MKISEEILMIKLRKNRVMSKKNRKNKKPTELKGNTFRTATPRKRRPTDILTFAHEFTEGVVNDTRFASAEKLEDLREQSYAICILAWNISVEVKTYEKSLKLINTMVKGISEPSESMPIKYLLLRALRTIFSLSINDEKMVSSLENILSPEEWEFFNSTPTDDELGLDDDDEIPF